MHVFRWPPSFIHARYWVWTAWIADHLCAVMIHHYAVMIEPRGLWCVTVLVIVYSDYCWRPTASELSSIVFIFSVLTFIHNNASQLALQRNYNEWMHCSLSGFNTKSVTQPGVLGNQSIVSWRNWRRNRAVYWVKRSCVTVVITREANYFLKFAADALSSAQSPLFDHAHA